MLGSLPCHGHCLCYNVHDHCNCVRRRCGRCDLFWTKDIFLFTSHTRAPASSLWFRSTSVMSSMPGLNNCSSEALYFFYTSPLLCSVVVHRLASPQSTYNDSRRTYIDINTNTQFLLSPNMSSTPPPTPPSAPPADPTCGGEPSRTDDSTRREHFPDLCRPALTQISLQERW